MPALPMEIRPYLESILGTKIRLDTVSPLKIPFHLRDTYNFAKLTLDIGSQPLSMLLLIPVDDQYPGAVTLRKHLQQIEKATDKTLVLVYKSLSSADRRSLIGNHLNFIQPGSQLFIPELAMDLREQVRKRRSDQAVSTLLPATQAMLLGCIQEGWDSDRLYTSTSIMGSFHYSRVTLSKVIDQLLKPGLIKVSQSKGATNVYSFNAGPAETFRKAHQWMRSPVKRRVPIDRRLSLGDGVFLAGESALAKYTLLADPAQRVYGMTRNTFDLLLEREAFKVTDSVDDTLAWIEIWTYPSIKADNHIADEASLLLSLDGHPDERIQIALDEIREEVTWLRSGD